MNELEPTLNAEYNVLVSKGTHDLECEECGRDLTGEQVYDTGVSWVCADCNMIYGIDDSEGIYYLDPDEEGCIGIREFREDFHADG
jgi:hypothetical protein